MDLLQRIEINNEVLQGKPVIKGTRLSVAFILGLLAQGASFQEILEEYEGLTEEDLRACISFAAQIVDADVFLTLPRSVA